MKELNWQTQLANELHKPITRNFRRRRVIVNHIDEIFTADLVDMQPFSKWNKSFKFLLTAIDAFSRYAWVVALKNKKAVTVTEAFKIIFKERIPTYLWTDKGSEFYNKSFKFLLDKHDIKLYSTENEEKSSVIERFNRTLKERMWKQFTIQNNTQYLNILPKLVNEYNNAIHSSINMTPVEASKKKNESLVYSNLYDNIKPSKAKAKYKINDKVRISKYKRKIFDKGYTPN